MDAASNPYTPNAGAAPEVIVGRDEQLDSFRVLLQRLARRRTEQSMIITGLRGVGKTVLLGEFRDIAQDQEWIVVELEASKNDDQQFRRTLVSQLKSALLRLSPRARWTEAMKRAASVLTSFNMSVDPAGSVQLGWDIEAAAGFADHADLGLDLTDVLVSLGEAAQSKEVGIVLLIDEIQFLQVRQLEALIQAVHKLVQRKLPVTMIGAGLPQIAELVGDAKSYAERLFKFPRIGNLEGDDAGRALAEPAKAEGVEFRPDALQMAVRITGGYPYFIQELGYAVWPIASNNTITLEDVQDARDVYESKLDGSFFRVRLDRTTPLQSAYLRAMAGLGPEPQKAADVAQAMGRNSTQLGPTRAELIGMGLLYTPDHGYAAFTVPHFDKFMLRAMPELIVPELRARRGQSQST
ncbi:ATP-binding protein [Arthrobacter sp. CJ23]|uniref:ATP-binding protein n=1 Tax=Arthrobacter sp. CJ23 TaxID=2972479 RepID=UPI00215D173B|nr:ATP-binding protein [Arthrobacter sp. CJ23]UVJ38757.1 ATP-binding protein [Arthrobacter sp. CJ23]